MLFALIVLVLLNCLLLTGGVFVYVKARRFVEDTQENITALFTPENEGQLSAIGQMLDCFSQSVAERIGVTVQAAIRGSIGGTMKGVNAALEKEAIEENPNLAMMQALPKSLRGNPIAMMGLQAILSRMGSGSSGPRNKQIASPNNGQVKFNL